MPRVHAAIVTYNRGALLIECLRSLLDQSAPVTRVFVVDNASTDGTPDALERAGLLADERVVYERQASNLGGAGGYARAVALAREGADWIWVMDDDAEPRRDALERMLADPCAADPATAVLCQSVVRPDGSTELSARGHLERRPRPLTAAEHRPGAELGYASLVGLLVRGSAARATDPPRADFFIWCDDYEWCLRLRRHGNLRLVPESVVLHKEAGHGFQTRRGRLINRLTGWDYASTPYSGFWRNMCGIRNYVWLRKHYMGESLPGALVTVAQFAIKALLYDEKPLRRLPWIARAALDGRLGVFHTITPAEWSERIARGEA